eukprot:m51a1_g10484 hypothetical protein (109) ;mRNA; f:45443-45892
MGEINASTVIALLVAFSLCTYIFVLAGQEPQVPSGQDPRCALSRLRAALRGPHAKAPAAHDIAAALGKPPRPPVGADGARDAERELRRERAAQAERAKAPAEAGQRWI